MVSLMLCSQQDARQTQRFSICWNFFFLGSTLQFMIFSNESISMLKILVDSHVYSEINHTLRLDFKLQFVYKLREFSFAELGIGGCWGENVEEWSNRGEIIYLMVS